MPKVSVILSSYNHADYIAEAIESALNQTFVDFELLIFDDGSTDESQKIIRKFDDPRIKLFLYEKNRGFIEAISEPMKQATGKYIAIHHSDDAWEKDKLAKQTAFLDAHDEYAACFSHVSFMDENGSIYDLGEGEAYNSIFGQENLSSGGWLRHIFHIGNCLCHPSLLIRREMYAKHSLLNSAGIFQLPDALMWTKLLVGGERLYVYPEKLVRFRMRRIGTAGNTSAERPDRLIRANFEYLAILQEYKKLSAKLFAEAFPEYAKYIFDENISLALGKLCADETRPAYRLFGLETLYELLNDKTAAKKIREACGYDEHDFIADTGRIDCFNQKQNMHFARMAFVPDYGDGFDETAGETKTEYVRHNGSFSVKFSFAPTRDMKGFWFLPDKDCLYAAYMEECILNGEKIEAEADTKSTLGKYFYADDGVKFYCAAALPANESANVSLNGVIWHFQLNDARNFVLDRGKQIEAQRKQIDDGGKLLADKGKIIDEQTRKLDERNKQIEERQQQLDERQKIIDEQKAMLDRQAQQISAQAETIAEQERKIGDDAEIIVEARDMLSAANTELEAMRNSTSWNITKPLRFIGSLFR